MKKLVLTVMSLCLAVTMWGQTPAGSEWSPLSETGCHDDKGESGKSLRGF